MPDNYLNSILEKIQSSRESIKFYNNYRGLPVNNEGRVVKVGFYRVVFSVPHIQIVCMIRDHGTVLVHPMLPHQLHARVMNVRFDAGVVELGDFELANPTIGGRAFVRVEPHEPLRAAFMPEGLGSEKPVFYGKIIDLSMHGIGMVTEDQQPYDDGYLVVGKRLFMAYRLGNESIKCEGLIKNLKPGRNRRPGRVGINTNLDLEQEKYLTKFLAQRQKDLLQELKDLCTNM